MPLINIDHKQLTRLIIKPALQKPKRMAGIYAYIFPFVVLYNRVVAFYNNCIYELARTSQVCHIRGILNDRWDAGLRRIEVVDGKNLDALYIFRAAENKPKYIRRASENAPSWLYKTDETYPNGIDFIVKVPYFIAFDTAEMIALVSKYRLGGKTFFIEQV